MNLLAHILTKFEKKLEEMFTIVEIVPQDMPGQMRTGNALSVIDLLEIVNNVLITPLCVQTVLEL